MGAADQRRARDRTAGTLIGNAGPARNRRDPPGRISHERQERRITADNPAAPIKKEFPSIRDGVIAWQDWRTEANKNPQGEPGFTVQAAPVRYQTGANSPAANCGATATVLNPEATDKGFLAHSGGTMPDGSLREALVLLACP